MLHTVVETPTYLAEAVALGLSSEERDDIIDLLAKMPDAGDVMRGTGGARKVRIAGRGRGKSGGYRVVTFFSGKDLPVFLVTIFGKAERDNLSNTERNELAKLTKILVGTYRKKVVKIGGRS